MAFAHIPQVGFKGIHWAWMGIAALRYAKGLGKHSGCRLVHSLSVAVAAADAENNPKAAGACSFAYISVFLARFPWKDVAMHPTGAGGCGFLMRHPFLKRLAHKPAVVLDASGQGFSMVSEKPEVDWLVSISPFAAGAAVPAETQATGPQPQWLLQLPQELPQELAESRLAPTQQPPQELQQPLQQPQELAESRLQHSRSSSYCRRRSCHSRSSRHSSSSPCSSHRSWLSRGWLQHSRSSYRSRRSHCSRSSRHSSSSRRSSRSHGSSSRGSSCCSCCSSGCCSSCRCRRSCKCRSPVWYRVACYHEGSRHLLGRFVLHVS